MAKSDVPALWIQIGGQKKDLREVWIRLEAFLSTRAPNTQITYKGVLYEWCRFLRAEPETGEAAQQMILATDVHAMAYRKWLTEQPGQKGRGSERRNNSDVRDVSTFRRKKPQKKSGLEATQSNATIWKKFAALRRMYRVLVGAGLVGFNPFDTDRVPPPPKDSGRKRPTEMIPFDLVSEIVSLPDPKTPKGQRDRGILAAFFGGGLRRSEVAALTIGDVRRSRKGAFYLYLRATKAKKDAEQAIPEWAAREIENVRKHRVKSGAKDGDFLFVTFTGRAGSVETDDPISHSGIYKLFKGYCMRAGAGREVSPHSARATAITKLLDDGLSHRMVQEFSRHSSVLMVEVYDKRRIGVDENPGSKLKF